MSLKYHAFFNRAAGVKQRLLERYLFMIRTITRTVAIMTGGSQSPTCVCVCLRNRQTPAVDSDGFFSDSTSLDNWLTAAQTGDLTERPTTVGTEETH